jgi:AraC-like DNA-binding protein
MSSEALAEQIARFIPGDGMFDTVLPNVALVRWSGGGQPVHMVQRASMCIIAQGAKRVIAGEQVVDYGPGQCLVAPLDLPITGMVTQASVDAPYLCFCLYLDPLLLSEIALALPGALDEGRGLSLHPLSDDVLDAANRLTALIGQPGQASALGPLVERELLTRLMMGPAGGMLRAAALADSRMGQIARAIRWLKAHYHEPFSGPSLADLSGMSTSSFHDHFRKVTAMTPLQYQKQLRLQEARRLMLGERVDAAQAGFRVGYDSPSQFSREYSRLFGAPPARDIGRLREEPALAMAV